MRTRIGSARRPGCSVQAASWRFVPGAYLPVYTEAGAGCEGPGMRKSMRGGSRRAVGRAGPAPVLEVEPPADGFPFRLAHTGGLAPEAVALGNVVARQRDARRRCTGGPRHGPGGRESRRGGVARQLRAAGELLGLPRLGKR